MSGLRVSPDDFPARPRCGQRRARSAPAPGLDMLSAMSPLTYRRWFLAAVAYNLMWGVSVVVYPRWFLWFAAMPDAAAPLAQGIGMMVAVFGYGYYLVARDPRRYRDYIWIALAGKTFGAIGYLLCASAGALPWRFGWQSLMNDLIWFPAFWSFVLRPDTREQIG